MNSNYATEQGILNAQYNAASEWGDLSAVVEVIYEEDAWREA